MDINYNELFGLEASEERVETADTPSGEETTETTENEVTEEQETEDPETEGEKESDTADQTVQSKEERSKYAAARRKAEADAAKQIEAEKAKLAEENTKYLDQQIAALGIVDDYTGGKITTKEQLEAYQNRKAEQRKTEVMEQTGMSAEAFDQFVGDIPEVKRAKEAEQQLNEQRQKMVLEEQIAEISKIDPTSNIKTVEDLIASDSYQTVHELVVKRGYSIPDAYKIANFERLTSNAAKAAKQSALNHAGSKNHLDSTTVRGQGTIEVPQAVKDNYRALMPDMTDSEIQAHYARFHKKK